MSLINDGNWGPARRKRRSWSVEDKRRIVEESLAVGASIAEVARRHNLNANQLFTWRRRFGVEQLEPHSHPAESLAPSLPVTIMADTTTAVHTQASRASNIPRSSSQVHGSGDPD